MKDIKHILAGLGGVENVCEIEPCVTRLRAEVDDPGRVDPRALRLAGCHGVVVRGRVVQVVVGPEADLLASDLADLTWGASDDCA
jgi:PTS system N-acetylglucosamine-specific IIB component